jgi:phosphohistidine phosphatase
MRTLYLLRHVKSDWSDPALADDERPLAPRGRRAGKRLAGHFRTLGIEPELVLCSPAERTRQTLELIRPALGKKPTVTFDDTLYGATGDVLIARLSAVAGRVKSLLVIGHNPGLHELALRLAADGEGRERLQEKFPTGALATLAIRGPSWAGLERGGADLTALVFPRDLG